jgi:hypothetical protein
MLMWHTSLEVGDLCGLVTFFMGAHMESWLLAWEDDPLGGGALGILEEGIEP